MRSMWSQGGRLGRESRGSRACGPCGAGGRRSRSGEPGAGHAVHQEPGWRLARSSRVSESNLSEPSRAGPDADPCSCYTKRSENVNDNGVTGYPRIPDPAPLLAGPSRTGSGTEALWARRVKAV